MIVEAPGGPYVERVVIEVEGEGEERPPHEHPPEEPPPAEPPPEGGSELIAFVSDPDAISQGGCAILHWEVDAAEWPVTLDGQEVPHVGEREVCPETTTTYALLVEAPEEPQERHLTLEVQAGPAPAQTPPPPPASGPTATPPPPPPSGPAPTPPPPPPSGPTPTSPPAPTSGSDVWPCDLYPDNQPQGNVWVRIWNNGPATLTNKKVRISGSYTRTTLTTPPTAQGANIPPAEYVLSNLARGQQQNINLGWQIDLSQYSYDFTVTVAAVDFTDPNSGNNSYKESFQGQASAQATIVFVNQSGHFLCYAYVRQAGTGDWGDNVLACPGFCCHNEGAPQCPCTLHGASASVVLAAGKYDLKARISAGKVWKLYNVNVSGTYTWVLTP